MRPTYIAILNLSFIFCPSLFSVYFSGVRSTWGITEGRIRSIYLLSFLVATPVLIHFIRQNSYPLLMATSVILTFWLVPYTLQYDFPLLLIPLTVALQQRWHRRHVIEVVFKTSVMLGMVSVLVWEQSIADGFWLVIGTTLLFSITYLQQVPHLSATPDIPLESRTAT